MKRAIVHDWLVNKRGAEHVLEAVCELYPDADIFTLVYDPERTFDSFRKNRIETSFIQRLPFAKRRFRRYLPLFPKAIEQFDLKGYDSVISINHCVAKGARVPDAARHACYCLTPMRYVWTYPDEYFGPFKGMLAPLIDYLKAWDKTAALNVGHFATISNHVKARINRCYSKDSVVIYPPVDVEYFLNEKKPAREDFYLVVSELVPYKRTEVAVNAFNLLKLPLIIIGDGPCKARLEAAANRNIRFLPFQPKEKLKEYYSKARALIYPQKEDFGIVAVEAQAAGCPVIAYRRGGAADTVIDEKTGVFFNERSRYSLLDAVNRFRTMEFDHKDMVENAKRFDIAIFKKRFKEFVDAP